MGPQLTQASSPVSTTPMPLHPVIAEQIPNKSRHFFYTFPHTGIEGEEGEGKARDSASPVNSSEFLVQIGTGVFGLRQILLQTSDKFKQAIRKVRIWFLFYILHRNYLLLL